MRVVVTGGAGFIGRQVVSRLAGRADDVVALVRDAASAEYLEQPHVELVSDDLSSSGALAALLRGSDAVVHAAGSYRIGVKPSERASMLDANLGTTQRVLDAAMGAAVPRIVYVSTVNVFGDTHGRVVDEAYRRDLADGFVSFYDETKFRAHEAAQQRITSGAPIVIAQPSQVYGPHDHSLASEQLARAHAGTMPLVVFADAGACWVHVHDLADGIVAALDRGRLGESYVLAGDCLRNAQAVALAASVGGRRPPRLTMPTTLLRAMALINDPIGGLPGLPANLRDAISAGNGVTYWATSAKAVRELGFTPRPLEQGIADTWGRGGK